MNTFVAKKLAEVQAFIGLGGTILSRCDANFEETVPGIAAALRGDENDLSRLVDNDFQEIFVAKVQKTTRKLTEMMELYIGDSWDDPVEVLEWLSFYSGAAAAHAALTASAFEALGLTGEQEELAKISDAFWQLLTEVKTELALNGSQRARE